MAKFDDTKNGWRFACFSEVKFRCNWLHVHGWRSLAIDAGVREDLGPHDSRLVAWKNSALGKVT